MSPGLGLISTARYEVASVFDPTGDIRRRFLEKLGLKPGQVVLEFACGGGDFSVPAAMTVGSQGRVVCLDSCLDNLARVMSRAAEGGLNNVSAISFSGNLPLVLGPGSFDFVMLFDILFAYRFPSPEGRSSLFRGFRKILKDDEILSYSPTNSAGYWGLTPSKLMAEVESCGFVQDDTEEDEFSYQGISRRMTAYSYRKG